MRFCCVLLLLAALSVCAYAADINAVRELNERVNVVFTEAEIDELWQDWKQVYGVNDPDPQRFATFKKNVEAVKQCNAEKRSYTCGLNQFSHLSEEEMNNRFHGLNRHSEALKLQSKSINNTQAALMPASVTPRLQSYRDWVAAGVVTPAKAQGLCGSCVIFAFTALVESHYMLLTGSTNPLAPEFDLSEQEQIDCGWGSCSNGWDEDSVSYHFAYKGAVLESSYGSHKYEGGYKGCRTSDKGVQYVVSGTELTGQWCGNGGDAAAVGLQHVLTELEKGPVLINMDARSLASYSGGIFDGSQCSKDGYANHAVLVVGASEVNGAVVFTIKNSWGPDWGENGLFRIKACTCSTCDYLWRVGNFTDLTPTCTANASICTSKNQCVGNSYFSYSCSATTGHCVAKKQDCDAGTCDDAKGGCTSLSCSADASVCTKKNHCEAGVWHSYTCGSSGQCERARTDVCGYDKMSCSDVWGCQADCPSGTRRVEDQCVACTPNCQDCLTDTQCQNCKRGFFRTVNKTECVATCPTHTYADLYSSRCEECHIANCSACSAYESCDRCAPGYYLSPYNNACVQSSGCPAGYKADDTVDPPACTTTTCGILKVHYSRRSPIEYKDWGLHVTNPTGTTIIDQDTLWSSPLSFEGHDIRGGTVYTIVQLVTCSGKLNFNVHSGDLTDMGNRVINDVSVGEILLKQGDATVYTYKFSSSSSTAMPMPSSTARPSSTLMPPPSSTGSLASSSGGPQPNTLIIHYKRTNGDYTNWGLHLWNVAGQAVINEAAIGANIWASPILFTGSDSYGVYAVIPLAAVSGPLNLIVHNGNVKDVDTNRQIQDVAVKQVWLLQGQAPVYTSNPLVVPSSTGGSHNPLVLTIHYNRPAGDYAGWGMHLWNAESSNAVISSPTTWTSPVLFTGTDSYGKYLDIQLLKSSGSLGFIVHNGDTKDVTANRFISVAANQVWLKQGDSTVYTVAPALAAKTLNAESEPSNTNTKSNSASLIIVGACVCAVVACVAVAAFVLVRMRRNMAPRVTVASEESAHLTVTAQL